VNIHQKVSRKVAKWNPNVVVNSTITAAEWRAIRRSAHIRFFVGLVLATSGTAFAISLWALQWDSREARVLGLGVMTVALILTALTFVQAAEARTYIAERHPAYFVHASERAMYEQLQQLTAATTLVPSSRRELVTA